MAHPNESLECFGCQWQSSERLIASWRFPKFCHIFLYSQNVFFDTVMQHRLPVDDASANPNRSHIQLSRNAKPSVAMKMGTVTRGHMLQSRYMVRFNMFGPSNWLVAENGTFLARFWYPKQLDVFQGVHSLLLFNLFLCRHPKFPWLTALEAASCRASSEPGICWTQT